MEKYYSRGTGKSNFSLSGRCVSLAARILSTLRLIYGATPP